MRSWSVDPLTTAKWLGLFERKLIRHSFIQKVIRINFCVTKCAFVFYFYHVLPSNGLNSTTTVLLLGWLRHQITHKG